MTYVYCVCSHSSHEIGNWREKPQNYPPARQDRIPSIVNIQGEGVPILSLYPSSDPPCSTAGPGGGAYHRSL